MRVEESVIIHRPVAEVFAYVTDPSRWPEWSTAVQEAEQVSEGPMRVGTRVRTVGQFLGRKFPSEQEITEYTPNQVFTGKAVSGPFPMTITSSLEPVDAGTRFTWAIEGESKGFFGFADPILKRFVKRQVDTQLGMLKDLLETGEEGATTP